MASVGFQRFPNPLPLWGLGLAVAGLLSKNMFLLLCIKRPNFHGSYSNFKSQPLFLSDWFVLLVESWLPYGIQTSLEGEWTEI